MPNSLFLSGKISNPTAMLNEFGKSCFHWVNKPQISLFSSSREPQEYSLTKMQDSHAKLKVFCKQEQCGRPWQRSAHFTGWQKIAANQQGLLKTTVPPFPLWKAKKVASCPAVDPNCTVTEGPNFCLSSNGRQWSSSFRVAESKQNLSWPEGRTESVASKVRAWIRYYWLPNQRRKAEWVPKKLPACCDWGGSLGCLKGNTLLWLCDWLTSISTHVQIKIVEVTLAPSQTQ